MPKCEKCGTYIEHKSNLDRHQRTKKCKALTEIRQFTDKGWKRIKAKGTDILDKHGMGEQYEYGYIDHRNSLFGNTESGYWSSPDAYEFLKTFMIPGLYDHRPKYKKIWEDDEYIVVERDGGIDEGTRCYYKENFENRRKRKFKIGKHDTVLYDLDGKRMGHLVPSKHIPQHVVNVMVSEEI